MDIIWPCVSTLALLLFSMLHLNVPASGDGVIRGFWRKLRWFLLGSLCPELPMLFAFAQLASARRSREDMKALAVADWTITHGFYADSGGFVLDIPGAHPFPITAKQLLYLVRNQHVDAPRIGKVEIDDKSKADDVAKCLTFFQSGRFIIHIIARAASGLHITPLELMSSAILFCSSITLCLWWHKPLNIKTPTILKAKCNISTLLVQAGDAAKDPFRDTPLDFIEPDIYWCSKLSHGGMMQRFPRKRWWQVRRPLEPGRGRASNDPQKSGIHFCGWSLPFPTKAEAQIWQVNCIVMGGSLTVYGLSQMVGFWRTRYTESSMDLFGGYKKRTPWLCLIVESVVSLRQMPAAAFQEVQWLQFLPKLM
ncbi:hypothetical protein B0T24DRAFT_598354 [Lasiosphaeria ovina]|uniref:Uncharacterized protein n=1 Tax=Lasiosphaeria ovina TaxID=92902 RepID=A0AAE0N0K5_9PEZI|nr:hypothetical protein B0T24DRAFT_598354 [Lasiosphaeria ovina]